MNMRRERVVAPTVVITEIAVCFAPAAGWFVVREVVHVVIAHGETITEIVSSPLFRRQLEGETGGPELADFLMAHPGSWWRLPVSEPVEEGDGA